MGLNCAQFDVTRPLHRFWVQFMPAVGLNRAQFDRDAGVR